MRWQRTDDPNLIRCHPFFIRKCIGPNGTRYVLGRDRDRAEECLGGFDTADEAKKAAERHEAHREQ